MAQEGDAIIAPHTRAQLQVRLPARRVDRQVQLRPAHPFAVTLRGTASLAASTTAPHESPEPFDVELDDLARLACHECAEGTRLAREELAQAMRAVAPQHPVRGASAHAEDGTDAIGSPAPLQAQRQHRGLAGGRGVVG